MTKILVVEDEQEIRDFLCMHAKREGLEALAFETAEEALQIAKSGDIALALVDWMLPGISGVEFARQVAGKFPILMITARGEPADIIAGLEAGADDYVTKPFELSVLMARVRSLLRRTQRVANKSRLQARGLVLDNERHEVTCDGSEVQLTISEFKLLKALLENPGRVLTREKLIALVQGEGVSVVDRAIDTHVFGLRKKLGPCSEVIETIRGVGYRVQSE